MNLCRFTLTVFVILVLICFVILAVWFNTDRKTNATVTTPQGNIQGMVRKTVNGRDVIWFLGIPYAKPPVGDLRFKSPVTFGNWSGVRDGSKEGSMCAQPEKFTGVSVNDTALGNEDCLFLNVFTPSVSGSKKFPVMAYFHGGGYIIGSSDSKFQNPLYLLEKDIVLVVINYRLGVLGFASSGDLIMPGNYGLKDQTMALKWIQENISAYGGNPDNVTIFGQSAGAASVHFHMMSPLSKGLFHRGIMMSGSAHTLWAINTAENMAEWTRKVASLVNCPISSSEQMVACLKNVSSAELVTKTNNLKVWDDDKLVIFTPVIEPVNVEDAFITAHPYDIKTNVPLMAGILSEEGGCRTIAFSESVKGLDETLSELNDRFEELAPVFMFYHTAENPEEITKQIRQFYFGNETINRNVLHNVTNMVTDSYFFQGLTSSIRNHEGKAYLYYFTQRSNNTFYSFYQIRKDEKGVAHGDDLKYIFPMNFSQTYVKPTEEDKMVSEKMVSLWTNFAIYGDPTPNPEEMKWTATAPTETDYLKLELGDFTMRQNLLAERNKFWQHLNLRPKRISLNDKNT